MRFDACRMREAWSNSDPDRVNGDQALRHALRFPNGLLKKDYFQKAIFDTRRSVTALPVAPLELNTLLVMLFPV